MPGPVDRALLRAGQGTADLPDDSAAGKGRSAGTSPKRHGGRSSATRFFNTVCLAAPEGRLVAHYRKLNPWPFPEKSWATPGDRGIQTFDTEYGRVGLAICFDIHTILDKYEDQKLWALLYPIAWVDDEHPAEWYLPPPAAARGQVQAPPDRRELERRSAAAVARLRLLDDHLGGGKVVATAKSLYGSEIVYADLPTAKPPPPGIE